MYKMVGTQEQAAALLMKAAKEMENGGSHTDVLEIYNEALTTFEESEKWHYVADSYKDAAKFAVKNDQLDTAAEYYLRHNNVCVGMGPSHDGQVHRNFLHAIVLNLALKNYSKADDLYQKATAFDGFGPSEASRAAAEILDAYEKSDQEMLTEAIKRNHNLTFLDGWVARLLKALKVPEEDAFGTGSGFRRQKVEKLEDVLKGKTSAGKISSEDPFGTADTPAKASGSGSDEKKSKTEGTAQTSGSGSEPASLKTKEPTEEKKSKSKSKSNSHSEGGQEKQSAKSADSDEDIL